MKESKTRTEQFMYTASSAASQPPSSTFYHPWFSVFLRWINSDSVLYGSKSNGNGNADPMGDGSPVNFDPKGKGRAPPNGDVLALDLDSAEEGSNGGALMQMQLVEQQVQQNSVRVERSTHPSPGYLYSATLNGYRIDRNHNCRAWPNLHTISAYGR